jgi:hypothetical protein
VPGESWPDACLPRPLLPRSAVSWLTEDLIHAGDRLHKAIHPDDNNDQPDETNRCTPAAQAGTSATALSRDELDNSTPIGNQITRFSTAPDSHRPAAPSADPPGRFPGQLVT